MSNQELVNIIWQRAELSPIGVPSHAQWQQALMALKAKADELDAIKEKGEWSAKAEEKEKPVTNIADKKKK